MNFFLGKCAFSESYCKAVGIQSCTAAISVHHPNSRALLHSFPHELMILINDISENMPSCFKRRTTSIVSLAKWQPSFLLNSTDRTNDRAS